NLAASAVDLAWYPPRAMELNNLTAAVSGTGVYGFIYNGSETPADRYGTYNWCNMPHVRAEEYPRPERDYELVYVELVQRHHKRPPSPPTLFRSRPSSSPAPSPRPRPGACGAAGLFYYGDPAPARLRGGDGGANRSAHAYWRGYASPINPFAPASGEAAASP